MLRRWASGAAAPEGEPAERHTWKESAGRAAGPDGYRFGDVTRGVVSYVLGGRDAPPEAEQSVEAEGDQRYSQVQRLVRDAVLVYRQRGYVGTINISQRVGIFTESCSVSVKGSEEAPVLAGASPHPEAPHEPDDKAGPVFTTLFARLERRAAYWETLSGTEGLDPVLSVSAQIGFNLPVIKVGWGVSVTFAVTKASVLRWARQQALGAAPSAAAAADTPGDAEPGADTGGTEDAAQVLLGEIVDT